MAVMRNRSFGTDYRAWMEYKDGIYGDKKKNKEYGYSTDANISS